MVYNGAPTRGLAEIDSQLHKCEIAPAETRTRITSLQSEAMRRQPLPIPNESGGPQVLTDAPPNLFISSCPAATSGSCDCYWFAPFETKAESISVGGVWQSPVTNEPWVNATYARFTPGNYTVIAFDWWGQTAEQNFTVVG